MTLQQTISNLKMICLEEARNFEVSTTLIEIYLIKQLYARKKKRPLVGQYLKNSPLSILLRQWKGPFKVLDDKRSPTFLFEDGTQLAFSSRRDSVLEYKWDDFIRENELLLYTQVKTAIEQRLKQRLEQVETVSL